MNRRFYITKHCQQRYLERVYNNLNTSPNLLNEIFKKLEESKDITSNISNDNPFFLYYLYEKYKRKHLHIYKNLNLYFIVYYDNIEIKYNVVTCYYGEKILDTYKNTAISRKEIFYKISLIKKQLK